MQAYQGLLKEISVYEFNINKENIIVKIPIIENNKIIMNCTHKLVEILSKRNMI